MRSPAVAVVLVRPARAGNVAAACRAMKNMGLGVLRLVRPPPELSQGEARNLAYGAFDVLDAAQSFDSLPDAVADATLVAATSGRVDLPAVTPRRFAEQVAEGPGEGRAAVVFGPERTGLTTDELRLCQLTIRIPADSAHPSLNLAQAVLIVAYELFLANGRGAGASPVEAASAGELEVALGDLAGALREVGYLEAANPGSILAELRRLLARARPTPRELNLLRGVARQVSWAGRVAARRDEGA
jgi:TrmH family RNA methyltransferase